MAPSQRSRNNLKAGIFVVTGLVLAFVVIVMVGDVDRFLSSRSDYVLRFGIGLGVDGVVPGSPVKIGGLSAGRVVAVAPEMEDQRVVGALVTVELDSTLALYTNARIERVAPLLGGTAAIHIDDVGGPQGGRRLADGEVMDVGGGTAGGGLRRLVGEQNAQRISDILANLDRTLAAIGRDYDTSLGPGIRQLGDALADAREVIASIRADVPQWRARIDSTLRNVDEASTRLSPLLEDGRALVGDLRDGTGKIVAAVDDNRGSIDEIVRNVRVSSDDLRAILQRVRSEMLDRVDALFDQANRGLIAFGDVGERLRSEIDALSPDLESALADARLMAEQLKLAAIEVRRSPWRLLYRPTDKELENELLFDAARSFAMAASDLRSSAETIDRVLSRDAEFLRSQPEQAQRVRDLLTGALQRYEQAQNRLFTIIVEGEKKSGR